METKSPGECDGDQDFRDLTYWKATSLTAPIFAPAPWTTPPPYIRRASHGTSRRSRRPPLSWPRLAAHGNRPHRVCGHVAACRLFEWNRLMTWARTAPPRARWGHGSAGAGWRWMPMWRWGRRACSRALIERCATLTVTTCADWTPLGAPLDATGTPLGTPLGSRLGHRRRHSRSGRRSGRRLGRHWGTAGVAGRHSVAVAGPDRPASRLGPGRLRRVDRPVALRHRTRTP